MDDYLNELFGNNEPKEEPSAPEEESITPEPTPVPQAETPEEPAAEVTAEEAAPAVEETAAPIIPEEPAVPVEPVIPEVPEVAAETPAPEVPAQPEPQQTAPTQSAGTYFEPANGAYAQSQGTFFTPPVPVIPAAPNANAADPNGLNAAPAPKKRNVALIIAIVAAICLLISGIGVASAIRSSDNSSDESSIFNFDNSGSEEEEKEDNSGAEVTVKSSEEAAKTDESGNLTAAGVAEKSKSSCVGITVYTEQSAYNYFYSYGQQNGSSDGKVASGEGSGVIMSEANGKTYIMTCAHVIADGSSFTVTLDDDSEYEATMVGYDSQTDIGVLCIEATGLSIAEFGDSDDIEVGEACVAIGCPGGLTFKNSVTAGIVSALDVPVSSSIGYKNECIQVDAAINPGNSGGALFNMQGQVIGINSSKIASTDYEGMGFAVPSNTAIETANSLIKNGYVAGRAKIGINYTTLANFTSASSIISALNEKGYENAAGTIVIQNIESESDLNGKVQQYDMIVAIEGETMTSTDVLSSALAQHSPGDTITLTIARISNNKIETFDVECKLIESKQ